MTDWLLVVVGAVVFALALFSNKLFQGKVPSGGKKEKTSTSGGAKSEIKKLLGIKNIMPDGTVVMDENRYARIYYLSSQDIDLMSEPEQEALELNLIAAMRALDCPVQFFTTTQRIETSQQVKEIEKFINDPANMVSESLKSYCELLKNALDSLQKAKELVVRKSYFVLYVQENNEKVAVEKLDQREKNVLALLKKANFRTARLSMPEVLQLLGDELNKNQVFKIENAIKSGVLDLYTTSRRGIVINDEVYEEVYGQAH